MAEFREVTPEGIREEGLQCRAGEVQVPAAELFITIDDGACPVAKAG